MGATFLELTNELLVSFNEVELTETEFASARGAQARAKNAIRNTVDKINQHAYTWPFNAVEKTQILTQGIEEYPWPIDFSTADWKSFQIQSDALLNVTAHNLKLINKDEWYDRRKDNDDTYPLTGVSMPYNVFHAHGTGFGVTPSPNLPYILKYRYYATPSRLNNHDDRTTIPSEYNHVIITGGAYWMHIFRENVESATMIDTEFKQLINNMRRVLLGEYTSARDTRVRY